MYAYIKNVLFFFSLTSAGTGKSTLLKEIVKTACSVGDSESSSSRNAKTKLFNNLYLLNVDRKDTSVYKKYYPYVKSINFQDLSTTEKKSCVVVEDIIHISKKDEIKLRNAINYQAHHKIQKIICASHAIYKNQIFSLLAFFNFVIFTSAVSNVPTIRNVFNYFKVESEQINKWMGEYKKLGMGRHGVYFYFDCEKMTFNVSFTMLFKKVKLIGILGDEFSNSKPESEDGNIKLMQATFEKFVGNLAVKNEASSVFSIIINCINQKFIRPHDLTIIFSNINSKHKKSLKLISLVDYIIFLLSPAEEISAPLLAVHRFVQSFCYIPKMFMRNEQINLLQ